MSTLARILDLSTAQAVMIAIAESCTAGMIAAALTDLPGSSAMFERGFVTYTNAAKREMLGVKQQTLDTFGSVSEDVAQEMAQGALRQSHAQIALSVTGIAGPGGSEFKPEGRVCFAVAHAGLCHAQTIEFGALGRNAVRIAARDHGLELIREALSRNA